jgi:hypothetical protein
MNEHIPTKLIRGNKNKKPWISKEVKSLIRKRNKQYKKYKKTKDKMDLMSLYINTFLGGTLTFKGRRLDSINTAS